MWLCKNHDCATRTFEISQFRVMDGAAFCGGEFTALGRNLMPAFQGVSPDTITFAGNIELIAQVNRGAKGMSINDMPEKVQAADKGPGVLGLVGATCFALEPAYGRHGIYRLSNNKTTMIEMTKSWQR